MGRRTTEFAFETFTLHGVAFDDPRRTLGDALAQIRSLVVEAKQRGRLVVSEDAEHSVTVGVRTLVQDTDGSWRTLPPPSSWDLSEMKTTARPDRPDSH